MRTVPQLVGVAGLVHPGILFDAIDGVPVDSIVLTLAPPHWLDQSFQVLGRLVALGRNKSLRLLLHGCRTPEHVAAFLDELDQPVTGRLDELAGMSLSLRDREQRDPWRELAIFTLTREHGPARDRQDGGVTGPR
jgi:hypothetical protein